MFTGPFSPPPPTDPRALALALVLACSVAMPALAKQGDRQQTIHVDADHFKQSRQAGTTVLSGNVIITQGSLKARAHKGTAYTNDEGKTVRIVLVGTPAHLQQRMDNGSLMRARANTINYRVVGETITLHGDAHVRQPGQGSFDGAELVYNPDTGAIRGDGGESGRVHLTLEPQQSEAD